MFPAPVTFWAPDWNVHVSGKMVSLAVKDRVTVSASPATDVLAYVELILTMVRVGMLVSTVTDFESVVEVAGTPKLPVISVKFTLNVTMPSASPAATV
jgi:hypothetical protein